MDENEREAAVNTEGTVETGIAAETIEGQPKKSGGKKAVFIGFLICILGAAGIGAYVVFTVLPQKGYKDYTVQKEQYYVEYSEQYDYWDVLTVEYPRLEGVEEEQEEKLNRLMYDAAMNRVNYWHLEPDEDVKELQEEYSLFCSDVRCDVTYHSQYLLSVYFEELYAPISPVYYTYYTERGLNMDLMTGENYGLSDIFLINAGFIDLWCKEANREYGDSLPYTKDTCELLFQWFWEGGGELGEYYEFSPFFYITKKKEFTIGIAVNPKPAGITGGAPESTVYSAVLTAADLEPYRIESEFWDKYDKSENAGRVFECLDLQENLWLGEDASIWDYWSDR